MAAGAAAGGGDGGLTRDELRDWCRARLAPFKLPEVVVFVDALPVNELGKLPRRAVVELISTRVAAGEAAP